MNAARWLGLPLYLAAAAPVAQPTVLEVRAQVTPALDALRALDRATGSVVSVVVADSDARYRCRLVLRNGILCHVQNFPSATRDFQLVIDAPGYGRATRTVPEFHRQNNRLVAEVGVVHLQAAEVTSPPPVVTYDLATQHLKLSVTNGSAKPLDVSRITLDATRATGACAAEDPITVFQLSSTLYLRRQSAERWMVESTARDPENGAEHLRVTGELVRDGCYRDRLVLSIPSRISIAPGRHAAIDLVLPERFVVESRSVGSNAASGAGVQGGAAAFDGSIGRFDLYVITFQTSSETSPRVVTFTPP